MQKITKENHDYNLNVVARYPINSAIDATVDGEMKLAIVRGYHLAESGKIKLKVLDIYSNEVMLAVPRGNKC